MSKEEILAMVQTEFPTITACAQGKIADFAKRVTEQCVTPPWSRWVKNVVEASKRMGPTEACGRFEVSRTTMYHWRRLHGIGRGLS